MSSTEELLSEQLDNSEATTEDPKPTSTSDVLESLMDKGEVPEAKEASPEPQQAQTPEPEPEDLEPVIPPASLTAEEKEQWKAWNKDVQRYIARREKERDSGLTRKTMELSQKGRFYDAFRQTVSPHLEQLQRAGVDPHVAYNRMLAWHNTMMADPVNGALQFLEQYGIDPSTFAQGAPQGGQPRMQQQASVPPELLQEIKEMRGILGHYQQSEAQRMYEAADSEAKGWLDEKNEAGDLLRPYAKELQEEMVPVVAALKAANQKASNTSILNKAYKAVLDDHPEITEAIEKQKEAKAKAAKIAASNQAAKKARGAVVSLRGSPGGQPARVTPRGTANVLEAVMDGTLET